MLLNNKVEDARDEYNDGVIRTVLDSKNPSSN